MFQKYFWLHNGSVAHLSLSSAGGKRRSGKVAGLGNPASQNWLGDPPWPGALYLLTGPQYMDG